MTALLLDLVVDALAHIPESQARNRVMRRLCHLADLAESRRLRLPWVVIRRELLTQQQVRAFELGQESIRASTPLSAGQRGRRAAYRRGHLHLV